jgi:ribosomal protein S15
LRQEVLGRQRTEDMGSPVRGKTTPFVESFDVGRDPTEDTLHRLDHFIKPDELEAQLERSKMLMTPLPVTPSNRATSLAEIARIDEENVKKHARDHSNVQEVMKRLLNLDNGSSKGRYRVNVQRCIETFGRHNTDKVLPLKPMTRPIASSNDTGTITTATEGAEGVARQDMETRSQMERKGPDTGSSEVQIAILTAKIRSLANFLDTRGRKDKVGKRDLRLLVHRRQKLLKYLRKKERGGPRWQRCIETLGLTEGTWKGEISL